MILTLGSASFSAMSKGKCVSSKEGFSAEGNKFPFSLVSLLDPCFILANHMLLSSSIYHLEHVTCFGHSTYNKS